MVAKLGTLKTQEYRQTLYGNGSSLKLNSVNAVKLENQVWQKIKGMV